MEHKRILVPVEGDTADEEAMSLACGFALRGKGEVFVLYVIEVSW